MTSGGNRKRAMTNGSLPGKSGGLATVCQLQAPGIMHADSPTWLTGKPNGTEPSLNSYTCAFHAAKVKTSA